MDPIIQSQIKSPLIRTLQSIPTNSSNFIHSIPDNTPPYSKSSVEVQNTGSTDLLTDKRVFKIPQRGHLNRAWVRYRMIGHKLSSGSTILTESDNVCSFGDGIEYIQLRSRNNVIETIPASVIAFEVASVSRSEQELKHSLQGLAGFRGASSTGTVKYDRGLFNSQIYDALSPSATVSSPSAVIRDYLILVPLSSTFYLKDNIQTRMMEDLELVVKMKTAPIQFASESGGRASDESFEVDKHEVTATFDFINFHENVEEVIRNENFKPDIPASLLQSDYTSFEARYKSSSSIGASGTQAVYECALNTDALATDIFVVPKITAPGGEYTSFTALRGVGLKFELYGGNDVLLEGFKHEYDGVESIQYSTVTRQCQNSGVLPYRWCTSGTRIRLGLNNTDEYFDGGISFQSLIEPKLIIKLVTDSTLPSLISLDVGGGETSTIANAVANISFDVVLKRKVLLRIDGNTGKIAKSLES